VKTLVQKNTPFFIPYVALLVTGALLFSFYSKAQLHLFLDTKHSSALDVFFIYFTYLGDGWVPVLLTLLLLCFSYAKAIVMALSNFFASFVTQLLKHGFFKNAARPQKYFSEGAYSLHSPVGIEKLYEQTFPSGHATVAFATFLCLCFFTDNKQLKLLCFFMACVVAYSRVFLNHHFLTDVYAGSLIAVAFTLLVAYGVNGLKFKWLTKGLLAS
jgi:membrane-associated phospholipid phosphatase